MAEAMTQVVRPGRAGSEPAAGDGTGASPGSTRSPATELAARRRGPVSRILASLKASIGDVAFGMEDGAVSIAGLVFGVAASTSDAHVVLLAGATGAAAGAVSMMAGTYLDVVSTRDRSAALRADARRRIGRDGAPFVRRAEERLRRAGFSDDETKATGAALARNPDALLEFVAAFELGLGRQARESPWAHAAWMFIADLIAAATPVLPFALLGMDSARAASLVTTTVLLLVLGVGRARITHRTVLVTTIQTLAIAATAAVAGIIIGRLVIS
jgi:VIT1/CCC1 family predicted Fe2+/Mn2+ transporter